MLSLSEVFPVNFMQHKLNIDPGIVLPKKAYQKPMTEPQREFFNDIVDDMEMAGIIQVVPADSIKCLNSTHLALKDEGKNLGMTRATLLCHCNQQCQANGLRDFWEQVEGEEEMCHELTIFMTSTQLHMATTKAATTDLNHPVLLNAPMLRIQTL